MTAQVRPVSTATDFLRRTLQLDGAISLISGGAMVALAVPLSIVANISEEE